MSLKVAPDKGWAWVVVIAACLINMVMSGLSRMVALLYVEVINTYGVSRQDATIPFSVRNSVRCISGPLVGLVGQRYNIRNVTFWGCVLSIIGCSLCALAPNVLWLTVFWGVVSGIGFAFGNTLFLLVVSQYFEKHKTTACGIALSGGCLGSLLFPFMFESIMSVFDLHGAFLTLGAVIMQILPLTLLLSSPPWIKVHCEKVRKVEVKNSFVTQTENDTALNCSSNEGVREEDRTSCRSLRATSFTGNVTDVIQIMQVNVKKISAADNVTQCSLNTCHDNDRKEELQTSVSLESSEQNEKQNSFANNCGSSCRTEEPFNGSINKVSSKRKASSSIFVKSSLSIFNLYKNPLFVLLNFCLVAYAMVLLPVSTVIVDYGKDKGFSEADGKFLIISIAIGDLVGRLCFGWVTDRKFMSTQKFVMFNLVIQGVIVTTFSMMRNFTYFVILLSFYGIASGCSLVVLPPLIIKYVSVEEQALAMSCSNFLAGIASFGIPPLIGYFRDYIGSYDGLFYICGGISILTGLSWFLEPTLTRYRDLKIGKH